MEENVFCLNRRRGEKELSGATALADAVRITLDRKSKCARFERWYRR